MASDYNPKTCSLKFAEGTVYKDLRKLGGNAYRDIKMSLSLGTSSDIYHYLKKYSSLLKGFSGNEMVTSIYQGSFSSVYLMEDKKGEELIIKRSHDGWIPVQLSQSNYISFPREIAKIFFPEYDITPTSLKRDVYDYEEVIAPSWGKDRLKLEGKKFTPYLNMALHCVDQFLPELSINDIYSKKFWDKMLKQKKHKYLPEFQRYLRKLPTQKLLIPEEERFIFYDIFSNSLQTIFLQKAMRGKKEILPDKKMVFPYELISEGIMPAEMSKVMIEHILRSIESFVSQLGSTDNIPKVPDFRPVDAYKIFPPTPFELYFAETANLVAFKDNKGHLHVSFVDTHVLRDPQADLFYKWTERRCWMSLFLNLRFWVRKVLDAME